MANLSARKIDREIDRSNKIKRAVVLFSEVKKIKFDRNMYRYSYNLDEDKDEVSDKRIANENRNLLLLAKLYEKLNPNWKAEFNAFEEKRTDKKYGLERLNAEETLFDVISGVMENDSDNASVVAMNMYLANKIAHSCSQARDRIVEKIMLEKYDIRKLSESKIKEASNKIKKYFVLKYTKSKERFKDSTDLEQIIKNIREELKELKIEDKELDKLEKDNFYKLMEMEMDFYAIKDFEMTNFIARSQRRDRLYKSGMGIDEPMSYGMAKDEYGEEILVIDLPYFSQFSVHMKGNKEAISALSNTIYDREIYARETVILTEGISPEVKEDLKKAGKDFRNIRRISIERIRSERRVAEQNSATQYAHHMILKGGGSKKELDELVYGER